MRISGIPAFDDNYLWLLEDGRHAAVVDPGDADPVEECLRARSLSLSAILVTHHHGDHAGGVPELSQHWGCPVFGPAHESIRGVTEKLAEGDRLTVPGLGLPLAAIDVPGHTAGHIAYAGDGVLFVGDTLFACGCGRLFEGTAAQMVDSLAKLVARPPETRAYCAHEYTLANIRFAEAVEPGNMRLRERKVRESERRARGEPTVPTTVGEELATNPFLRCSEPEVVASANRRAGRALHGPVEVFAALREWKNGFR